MTKVGLKEVDRGEERDRKRGKKRRIETEIERVTEGYISQPSILAFTNIFYEGRRETVTRYLFVPKAEDR